MHRKKHKSILVHLFGGEQGSGEHRMLQRLIQDPLSPYKHVVIDLRRDGKGPPVMDFVNAGVEGHCTYIPLFTTHQLGEDEKQANVDTIVRQLHEIKPDAMMGWAMPGNAYALLAQEAMQKPPAIILRLSNPRLLDDMPPVEQALYSDMQRLLRTSSFDVIAISQSVAKKYAALLEDNPNHRLHIIHNGVDCEAYSPEHRKLYRDDARKILLEGVPDRDVLLIGTIARFDAQKGIKDFLDAAQLLHAHNSRMHFPLIGKNQTRDNQELMEMIRARGLEGCVHPVGKRNIEQIIHGLDVSVLASRSEAFGNVLIESAAAGIPVVATKVGIAEESIGKNGELVSPKSPQSLAQGINKVFRWSPEERWNKLKAARERIENEYPLSKTMGGYTEVINTVLHAPKKTTAYSLR